MLSTIASLSLQDYLIESTTTAHPSLLRIRLSGLAGSTSLACWIVLILPQLVEQWRLKSADGIAPLFLILWTIGDIANFIGSVWAGLLPQVILLAAWFTVADFLTLGFYYYFTDVYPRQRHKHHHENADEESPLLPNEGSRRSSHKSHSRRRSSTLEDIVMEPENHSILIRYILPLLFVFGAGAVGYLCSSGKSSDDNPVDEPKKSLELGPQICGYISAILYLTARLPQIHQNFVKKSCKGLSLLFFMFSTLGNITYGMSILFYRNDWDYLVLNSSWLLGSLGTIAEDLVIFIQFYMYQEKKQPHEVFQEEEEEAYQTY